ncbi:MAG TPA: hemolysin family protein [Dehalococcoidia bacterium]|nr:hemolysin family protein [Dehalococcoidia bacterium]
MDSESWSGALLLAAGLVAFVVVVAAEAGVIAAVRARALREPAESRLDALRRFSQERQRTLSSLALARNLVLVGVTATGVFLVLDQAGHHGTAVAATAFVTLLVLMLLQAFPRLIVARDPERWQQVLRPIVSLVRVVFGWPAMVLDLPVAALLRWWGRRHPQAAGEAEEVFRLVELEEGGGALPEEERQMIRGIMEMELTTVREVMVPRTDIVAVEVNDPFDRVAQTMVEQGYSRLPVYEGTIDNIIGVVHGKDLLRHLAKGTQPSGLREVTRAAYFVPEGKKVDEMLAEMKEQRISVAIVVDEYGGTAGLVTVEDLLEEIVGEIRDEFDVQEQEVQVLTAGDAIVDARVGIDDLNEMFDLTIQKNDYDSIGGFIVNELGRMPSVGDEVRVNGLVLRVLSVTGRRIRKVRVTRVETVTGGEGERHTA